MKKTFISILLSIALVCPVHPVQAATVVLKAPATKTYTKELPAVKKKTTTTTVKSTYVLVTDTTTITRKYEHYTKGSNIKEVTTKVEKTVKNTQVPKMPPNLPDGDTSVERLAPKMDAKVLNAFDELKFTVKYSPSASYSGYFSAADATIILRDKSSIYHELGHFLAFVANGADCSSDFKTIYTKEKSAVDSYAASSTSEYFADAAEQYALNPYVLRAHQPLTFNAVKKAIDCLTDAQIKKVWNVYHFLWE